MPLQRIIAILLIISFIMTVTKAHADAAADEVISEIKLLTQSCLSTNANTKDGFPELRKYGYKEKGKVKRIDYSKTLKQRQAVLSRPKVNMHFYRKEPTKCLFGFLYLAPGAETGMIDIVGKEAAKLGYKKTAVNKKPSMFKVAEEFYDKDGKQISIFVSLGNGYISVGINEVR